MSGFVPSHCRVPCWMISVCFLLLACTKDIYATEPLSIEVIMQRSGISGQLHAVAEELLPSVKAATLACKQDPVKALPVGLTRHYSAAQLHSRAREFLLQRLNQQTLSSVSIWLNSSHGKAITSAELNAALWSAEEFDAQIESLQTAGTWTQERRQLISSVIAKTGAHRYVAALTASTSELTRLIELCSAGLTHDSRQSAITTIENDLAFIAMFMRMELMLPTGAVLQEVTSEALRAYIEFAASSDGKHFHETLAQVFVHVLLVEPPEQTK